MGPTYLLNLDSQCNQACLICMKEGAIRQNRRITFRSVCEEIKKAKLSGHRNIDFYGGEPTTYDFLENAINFANKMRLSCFLATNATGFYSYKYTASFFTKNRIDEVRTTLYSHRPGVHDRITQVKGSFRKTTQGIKNILRFGRTKLSVNVVITSLNYKDLSSITKFLSDLGVENISFSGLVVEGRMMQNMWLMVDLKYAQPYLLQALGICDDLDIDARIIKLPACIIHNRHIKPHQIVAERDGHNFIKLFLCRRCLLTSVCNGFEKYSLVYFGIPPFYDALRTKARHVRKLCS